MDIIARLQTYYRINAANQGNKNIPVVGSLTPERPTNRSTAELPTPILTCTAAALLPITEEPALEYVILSSESSLTVVRISLDVNAQGFDPNAASMTDADADAFRADLITNRAITATLNGRPVAAGMFTPPIDGLAELVGITTLVPYRGRGIGGAVTRKLAQIAFTHGVDMVFLRTSNPIAYRVYERIGFQPVASLMSEG